MVFFMSLVDRSLLGEPEIEVVLFTIRTAEQGARENLDENSEEYVEAMGLCKISEEDFKSLSLREGDRVKITTNYGSAVVKVVKESGIQKGVIAIPIGPWANLLTGPPQGSSIPHYKNIKATIKRTTGKITPIAPP